MLKWLKWLQTLSYPKKKIKYVSLKEVKKIYRNKSKNQLIQLIIMLTEQNVKLKEKKK